jgi:hypothetical protein
MRTTLKRFRDRTPAERRAVTRAGMLIAAIQTALAVLSFRQVMRLVSRVAIPRAAPAQGSRETSQFDRDLAVWAVEAAGRRLLSKNPCLPKALAVLVLFRRGGEEAELHLGVARSVEDSENGVRAHAWVESKGEIVIGGDVPIEEYVRLPGLDQKFTGRGGGVR